MRNFRRLGLAKGLSTATAKPWREPSGPEWTQLPYAFGDLPARCRRPNPFFHAILLMPSSPDALYRAQTDESSAPWYQ